MRLSPRSSTSLLPPFFFDASSWIFPRSAPISNQAYTYQALPALISYPEKGRPFGGRRDLKAPPVFSGLFAAKPNIAWLDVAPEVSLSIEKGTLMVREVAFRKDF